MAISEKRLKAAERQRIKRIQAYFKAYISSIVINKKKYAVLDKREINGEYYFLLQGLKGNPFVAKLIYSCGVKPIRLYATSNCYKQHKELFDNWIKQMKAKQGEEIEEYYEKAGDSCTVVAVRNKVDSDVNVQFCRFIAKMNYKGKYYFIVRNDKNDYFIVKIVYYDFPGTVRISKQEFEENEEKFKLWLQKANGK